MEEANSSHCDGQDCDAKTFKKNVIITEIRYEEKNTNKKVLINQLKIPSRYAVFVKENNSKICVEIASLYTGESAMKQKEVSTKNVSII